jgi:hypothetical protein
MKSRNGRPASCMAFAQLAAAACVSAAHGYLRLSERYSGKTSPNPRVIPNSGATKSLFVKHAVA